MRRISRFSGSELVVVADEGEGAYGSEVAEALEGIGLDEKGFGVWELGV